MLHRFYKRVPGSNLEECHYFDLPQGLSEHAEDRIRFLLNEPGAEISREPFFLDSDVVEIGPRVAMETSHSSTGVNICKRIEIGATRIEVSMRYPLMGTTPEEIRAAHLDPMTQEIYRTPLAAFGTDAKPEPMRSFSLAAGESALRKVNAEFRFGIAEEDLDFFVSLFPEYDPTDAALMLLANAMSDHSRHGTIKGRYLVDGVYKPKTIIELVQEPWKKNPGNNLVGFHDNAGVMRGHHITMLMPEQPGRPSRFVRRQVLVHITITSETHNHPSWIAPEEGAKTGVGGELRDEFLQGRGALYAGINCAGYAASNPRIPGYAIPGEVIFDKKSVKYASALETLIGMSNGACQYANEMGRPITFGFCRTFDKMVEGRRRGWVKPICYVGGVARVDDRHVFKRPAEVGMLILGCGGPARRIGVGGGSASSVEGGANAADIDFASVQRGDAIMESCANRVVQACAEMGDSNPIEDGSDQGAGGPGNLFLELVGKLGGTIDLEKIVSADPTLSSLERLIGEYQERYGFLIRKENLPLMQEICDRENVSLENLGEITGNGRFLVISRDGLVVDLSIAKTLAEQPQKEFVWDHLPRSLVPLEIPKGLSVRDALEMTLQQISVGSKAFLTRKGDRSVGGLVVQQQCVGPKQVPVSDVAVMADSFFDITGSASALGEQPIKGLVNAKAGARMAVAEMLTNICSALVTSIPHIECRLNEMCAAKQPGEGALLYDGVEASCALMEEMKFAPNGGKDSLSMAAKTDTGEWAVAPGQLVVFGTAPMEDIRKVVTPELMGGGIIGFIDIGGGKNRLGGSALAQALNQVGNESPDIDDAGLLNRALAACQQMIREGLITAYHDRSDGGLITTIVEMCLAGNCGARIDILDEDPVPFLFNEEAGFVFEFRPQDTAHIGLIMGAHGLAQVNRVIGMSGLRTDRSLTIRGVFGRTEFKESIVTLRQWWEATSDQLDMLQANPETVREEIESYADESEIPFTLTFVPAPSILTDARRPKVAVVRAEGTNGDREMVGVLEMVGFDVADIAMRDILNGKITSFDPFRGIVFPGGFADGDTFGSAKGWAASILFNGQVKEMFDRFYARPDTFSLGVCNGCQLSTLIGWVPHPNLHREVQPRLVRNHSRRFDSRWAAVRIEESPSIFFKGMEGSILGVHNAHGEGRFEFSDASVMNLVQRERLASVVFVGTDGEPTEQYPYNPNGSPKGIAGLCSLDGRHLAMMPHPERCFLTWQSHYLPQAWRRLEASPWLRMFQNAREWCIEH